MGKIFRFIKRNLLWIVVIGAVIAFFPQVKDFLTSLWSKAKAQMPILGGNHGSLPPANNE